jgi:hypothetical protein
MKYYSILLKGVKDDQVVLAASAHETDNRLIFRDASGNILASYALDSVAGWKYLKDEPASSNP